MLMLSTDVCNLVSGSGLQTRENAEGKKLLLHKDAGVNVNV